VTGSRRARTGALVTLLTCPAGQACSPLIYEIATETDGKHTDPGGSTGMSTDPTPPQPTDDTGPTSAPDPTASTEPEPATTEPATTDTRPTCDDGVQNGDETDLDCGGPCQPCAPGQACQGPADCAFGTCLDNFCQKPQCQDARDCPFAGPCQTAECMPGGSCEWFPAGDGEACDSGDPCLGEAVCKGGTCVELAPTDCSAFDGPCRVGVCNPKTGNCAVEWLSEGEPCDDGLDCTVFEQCSQGECLGKPPPGPLLFTDFSDAFGWKAEPPWQIGPAKPSQCSFGFAEDPKDDHSPGPDSMLAGAAIGGCLPMDAFLEACLESPPVDVMFMPGELWLTYWSVLSSADAPMTSRVDVFASKNKEWLPLLVIDSFTSESEWTEHFLDLTPFKSPELRVRFCHASAGKTEPVGGWSIDDLGIGAPQCL
jgi:hypothetical protein